MPAPGFNPRWMFTLFKEYVTIPGYGGGPDGPKEAEDPAQERWMREHSGLKEVWYLTWELDCTHEEMLARIERWRTGQP